MKNTDKNKLEIEKALKLIQNSSFKEAINLLKKLTENNSYDFRSYYLLGISYLKLSKLDLAENNFRKSIELNDRASSLYHNLGITLSLKNNFEESNFFLLKSLELDPNNIEAIIEIARNFDLMKNFADAKKNYQKALSVDPKNKIASNLLGRMLLNNGYHKEGLEYLKKSSGLIRFNEKKLEILK